MEIFVSYRHEDWPFTQRLVAQLGQFIGGTIFMDSTGIDDPDFTQSIEQHLQQSNVVLLVVSQYTFASERIERPDDWIRREMRLALQHEKHLVLVGVNGLTLPLPTDVPEDIRDVLRRQGVPFYPEFFDAAVERLAEFIDKITAPPLPADSGGGFFVTAPVDGQVVRSKDLPLKVQGRYIRDPGLVWVVLQDTYGHYYLQNPPLQILSDGRWEATNVLPGPNIAFVHFVQVDKRGHRQFEQMVKQGAFGSFDRLPKASTILRSVRISRVS